jgi:ribosome-binding factor A
MPREFSRTRRVGELIQHELAVILQREVSSKQFGMLTISQVEVLPDYKTARVFISILGGDENNTEQTIRHLNNHASMLRHHLSQQVNLRSTPRLVFKYDNSIEYGSRLSALIDSVIKKSD